MNDKILFGYDYNEKYKDKKLVKLSNGLEKFNEHHHRTGLNIDIEARLLFVCLKK